MERRAAGASPPTISSAQGDRGAGRERPVPAPDRAVRERDEVQVQATGGSVAARPARAAAVEATLSAALAGYGRERRAEAQPGAERAERQVEFRIGRRLIGHEHGHAEAEQAAGDGAQVHQQPLTRADVTTPHKPVAHEEAERAAQQAHARVEPRTRGPADFRHREARVPVEETGGPEDLSIAP